MESSAQSGYYNIIFVLGPPGSGKGTLCKLTTNRLNTSGHSYRHLSVGDYLRQLCETGVPCEDESFDFDKIRNHLRESKLLPADVLIPVLEHKIGSILDGNGTAITWLVDGFPRNIETTLAFEEKIGKPVKVVVLECTHDTAQRRFLNRSREKSDDEKRFEKRYGEYVENMQAIREHYKSNIETICVDGTSEEYLGKFISALPPITTDTKSKDNEGIA
ncbi:P-loop containing nucleoside triphosphate hydrolase protein [Annulohypoxylon bovei var. microspora]|nr:P-loop containing nucleoside triphosphate hydrolase protein [Annulohypoxylon bovei var. microspora]